MVIKGMNNKRLLFSGIVTVALFLVLCPLARAPSGSDEGSYGEQQSGEVTVEVIDLWDTFNPYNKASDQEVGLAEGKIVNKEYSPIKAHALFTADRDDNKIHFIVKNRVEPASKRDKALWEVKKGDKVLESGNFLAGEEFEIAFEPGGFTHVSFIGGSLEEVKWDTFDFNAGVDYNGNGVLDDWTDEIQDNNFKLGVCTDADYTLMRGKMIATTIAARIFGAFGSDTMSVFNAGSFGGSDYNVEDATVKADSPYLQLKAGADFSKDNNVKRYVHYYDSTPASEIKESSELKASINKLLTSKKNEIKNFFDENPSVDSHVFKYPHYDGVNFASIMDLNLGLGGTDLDYNLQIEVKRDGENLKIESIHVSGEAKDLYDFRHWRMGGVLQVAWDLSQDRKSGHIYYNTVDLDIDYDEWDYAIA